MLNLEKYIINSKLVFRAGKMSTLNETEINGLEIETDWDETISDFRRNVALLFQLPFAIRPPKLFSPKPW